MLNRRDFITRGIVFTSCGVLSAQPNAASSGRRRVTVGGRRVKTIDFHCHCHFPEAFALMPGRAPTALEQRAILPVAERLRAMDEQGIDVQAISINAWWYGADRDLATKIIKLQNERLAELCAMHPDRFVGFASVALQHPDLAAQQLEEGVKKLGLRGAAIGGHIEGEELSSSRFDPFWAKAQELGVPIFLHPQGIPELDKRLQGNGVLTNVIGNPIETTIALSHLIFDATLDRFPNLKICAAHGGGYLPSYADRSDHGCLVFPQSCTGQLKKHPTEYLRQLYFDSLVFTPEALKHLIAKCGVSQIVIGTDYPYPWTKTAVDHILETPGLSATERRLMLGETAARLLAINT